MGLNRGIWLALLTALISGVAIFVNKLAVGSITPPLVFTATKNTGVAILVISWLVVSGKWKQIKKLRDWEIGKLIVIGVIGGSVPFYLFFTGLTQISAVNAALIHKSLVLWVSVLGYFVLRERLSGWQILAVLILFGGNLAVGGFEGFEYSTGELMILGATILWAIENVVAKVTLKTVDADLVVGARMGLGAGILLLIAIWQYPEAGSQIWQMSGEQWLWTGVTALTLLSYNLFWYRALKLAPVTLVATILVSSTLVTNVLSAIFVTQTWTWEMGVQAGIITVGVGLFVKELPKVGRKLLTRVEHN